MVKTVLKEVFIELLLIIAILVIVVILFYDYNPINKVMPNKIAYTTPENIKNEIEEENIENEVNIENKVYTIEGSDLNIYKKSKTYNPSKENPFASTVENENTTTSGNTVKTNTNTNGQTTKDDSKNNSNNQQNNNASGLK